MAKKSPAKKNKKPASRDNPFGSGFWRTHWKEALVIFTVAVALYVRCIPYDFVLDDQIVITDNEFTKNGFSGIPDIFGNDSFTGYFGEQKNLVAGSRYRPLSIAMFAIEYELAGLDPGLYHAVNIFLYGILCLLLFRVLHVILPSSSRVATHWLLGVPFIATLLFALHPIHTEAVANIKGRDEILALLFSLLAVYAGLRYAWRNAWPWLLASGVFLFTGILAKENAITFTAVIPLTLYFFTETNWKKWMLSAVPAAVASVSYVLIRLKVVGFLFAPTTSNSLLNDPFLGMSAAERSATITYTLGHYVRLLFFPVQLTHDYYPYHIPKSNWSDPAVILAAMIYLLFAVAAIYGFRRKAVYSYSILFFLATMSIISNVFFSIGTFMNERFAFMPSVAMCLVTAFYALRLHQDKRMPRWLIPAFLALYLGGFAVRSYTRIPAWKDRLSLNTAAVKVSKNSVRANCFMGTALFERARELPDRQSDEKRHYG